MYRSRPNPNGCSGVAVRPARLPPSSNRPWFPESATEWMASASIEEAPVSRNARNFMTAMPVFASRAATTALLPPSADIGWPLPWSRPAMPGVSEQPICARPGSAVEAYAEVGGSVGAGGEERCVPRHVVGRVAGHRLDPDPVL